MNNREIVDIILGQIKQPLWGCWEIGEKIGEGAGSTVYKLTAKRETKTEISALKIVPIVADSDLLNAERRKSIISEKLALAKNETESMRMLKDSPYIVAFEDDEICELTVNGEQTGYYALIRMEYLSCLTDMVNDGKLSLTEENVKKIAHDIGVGLKAAHDCGLIHRDIKPANIFSTPSGTFKLGDFGIAKLASEATTFAGTADYIAPEVYNAKSGEEQYTDQADLYSLGICLYKLMNGLKLPFEGESGHDEAVARRMRGEPLAAPANASAEFSNVILEACEYDTAKRYKSADQFLSDLSACTASGSAHTSLFSDEHTMLLNDEPTVILAKETAAVVPIAAAAAAQTAQSQPVYQQNNVQNQDPVPPQQYVDPYAGAAAQQFVKKKNGSKALIAGLIATIVVLAGAGVGIGYMLLNGGDTDDSSAKKKNNKAQVSDEDDDDEEETEKRTRASRNRKGSEDETEARTRNTTEPETEPETEAHTNHQGSGGKIDSSVRTGGSTFTVATWNNEDVPYLLSQWTGYDAYDIARNCVDDIDFINFDCGGGDASERYDQIFVSGDDLDVYFCEADWALYYINDDSRTLPLSMLGFVESDFDNIYSYTDQIGKDSYGVRKGVSWQAAPGGFAYRADLAEQYLGVRTPAEMQSMIGTWDGFVSAARIIADSTGGSVALADSVGGMWQAYSCGKTTPWVSNNTVNIDSFYTNFADIAKTLWDCGGVSHNTQWFDEWKKSGVKGNTMGYFVSTWGLSGFFLDAAGGVDGSQYGKWAFCQGPQSYFWGGTWIVVNPRTDNGEEARDFIYTSALDAQSMKSYAVNKPEFVNNVNAMSSLVNSNTVFNTDVTGNFVDAQNVYADLYNIADDLDLASISSYDASVKAAFVNAVEFVYLDGYSWENTVDYFYYQIEEQFPWLTW